REGRFQYANRALLDLWGLTLEEAAGKTFFDLRYPEELAAKLTRQVEQVFETRQGLRDETPYTSPTGAGGHYEYIFSPVLGADGAVEAVAGSTRDISSRKRIEQELQAAKDAAEGSLAQWRAVIASMSEGVIISDPHGNLLDWNETALRLYGYPSSSGIGGHQGELERDVEVSTLEGRQVPAADLPLPRALRGETFTSYELRLRRPDRGLDLLVSYSGMPLRDRDGNITLALLTLHDLTAERRAQEALRENAARLSLALGAAKLGTWSWDPATDRMTLSDRACEIYGIPAGTRATRTEMRGLLHADERAPAEEASDQAVAERGDYDVEYRVVRPDGRQVWVAAKGRGRYDAAGRIYGMLGVVQDVTRRKAIEEERELLLKRIEAERARLTAAFMQSPAFMCVLRGPAHVFEFVNEQYYQIVGRRDILGKPIHEALPELAGQGFFELLDRVYATGTPFVGKDMPALVQRRPDEPLEQRYFEFVYQPVQEPDGAASGIFVHGVDITERKLAEEQRAASLESERVARAEAERASRMKDDFLATLSHELRTPLNAILGWSQILRRQSGADDLARGLDTIERNARAQTKIIEDLLDMSRIVSGKVRLDVQWIDLGSIVQAAVETVRPAADAKGVRIQAALDSLRSAVSGDASRLQQVFWNLLSNAVKFTPRGGRVQVLLERVSSRLEVSVTDTGEGISPQFLPQVFDKFRQADASTTRRHGGLGLGLAIAKQLVELHGGSLWAQSAGPGQGATFTV
ncbi:MAG: PAS domain-containing protein, partial [Acidobacteriota bacterium]|nr:PAS domain-containing protein [Acidobacteriota bacterium]